MLTDLSVKALHLPYQRLTIVEQGQPRVSGMFRRIAGLDQMVRRMKLDVIGLQGGGLTVFIRRGAGSARVRTQRIP